MKRFTMMALLAGLTFAGCSKGDDLTGKMSAFKDQMCACKPGDSACADKVDKEEDAWEESVQKGDKPSDDTLKKLDEIKDKYRDCKHAARGE